MSSRHECCKNGILFAFFGCGRLWFIKNLKKEIFSHFRSGDSFVWHNSMWQHGQAIKLLVLILERNIQNVTAGSFLIRSRNCFHHSLSFVDKNILLSWTKPSRAIKVSDNNLISVLVSLQKYKSSVRTSRKTNWFVLQNKFPTRHVDSLRRHG